MQGCIGAKRMSGAGGAFLELDLSGLDALAPRVDLGLVDPSGPRDLVDRGVLDALLIEQRTCGVDDLAATISPALGCSRADGHTTNITT